MFSDFFLNRKSFLYFAVLAIAMQAFHFAQMDRQMLNGAFILNILTGMVCEFTVFGLAIHARQNKRIWLIAFTLLSASVNLVVTGVIPGVIGKIIWSVFLPIAIASYTEIFTLKRKYERGE